MGKHWEKISTKHTAWVAQLVKHLPSAQVTILEFGDGVLRQDPCSAESVSPSVPYLSLSNK